MTGHFLIRYYAKKIQSITLLRQKIGLITHYAITHCTFLITLLREKIGPITHYATKIGLITPLRQPMTPPLEGLVLPLLYLNLVSCLSYMRYPNENSISFIIS